MTQAATAPDVGAAPAGAAALRSRVSGTLATTFDALSVRDYRLLFQGNAVTSVGYWMQHVALGWLVLELSNSPFYLGLAGFSRSIPMLVISPFGGVVADRMDRRAVLVGTQVAHFLLTALLALLVLINRASVWHVLVASALMGAATSVHVPARQALVPALVGRERLTNALAIYSMSLNASRIVGPSLAGVLLGVTGAGWCLALQSLGYAWAVANTMQIRQVTQRRDGLRSQASGTVVQHLVEGFAYCYRSRPLLLQLVIAAVPAVFAYPYMQLLPAFARDVYHIGPGGLGLLFSAMGIGALAGSFAIAARRTVANKTLLTLLAAAAFGGFLCLFALAPGLPLALGLLAAAGAASSVYNTLNGTILQELTDDEFRGRVSSVYMVTWGLMPLGALPAGALAEVYGAPATVFLGGAICLLFSVVLLMMRQRLWQAGR